jgi:hypothetical protein
MHRLAGDKDAVSAAQRSPDGAFQLYLNATPRQGTERLPDWAAFRLRLLRSDDAVSAHAVAAAEGVKFRGGTGSCVIDDYVTRIGAHHYEEIACLVQGRTSASVIVAAAPAATWAGARPLLLRAVDAYVVRLTRKEKTMAEPVAFRLRQLASPRRPKTTSRDGHPAIVLLLRLGCVALLAWIGYIHLHLWQEGYRQIPTNGPLFLLDAVAGFILAAALLIWPRPLAGLLAVGYTASTLGALIISLSVGLFGFRESISASFVTESLTIESVTVLALISWTILVAVMARRVRLPGHAASQP